MVAARAIEYHMEEAKERQRAAGGDRGNQYTGGTPKVAVHAPVHEAAKPAQVALPGVEVQVSAPVHQAEKPAFERQAVAQAGKAAGVSGRSVASAKYILDHGTEEEIKSVESGKAGLKPVEQQVRARVRQQPEVAAVAAA